MEEKGKKTAPGNSRESETAASDTHGRPSGRGSRRRSQIDSTLYFIERDGDDVPLSHFEKFDIT